MENSRIQGLLCFLARVQCIALLVQGIRVLKSYNKTRNFVFSPKFLYNFDYAIYKFRLNVVHFTVFRKYKHSAQCRHNALTLTFFKILRIIERFRKKIHVS